MRPLKIKSSYEIVFSAAGPWLLSLSRDVNLWSISERKKKWSIHPFSHPSNAVFSPDDQRVAVKNTAGQIIIVDCASGETLIDCQNQSEGEGSNLCFSPTGCELIDGSWNGVLTVRSAYSGEIVFRREFPGDMITRTLQTQSRDVLITEHKPKNRSSDDHAPDGYFMAWTWPLDTSRLTCLSVRFPYIAFSALSPSGTDLAVVFGAPPKQMVVQDVETGVVRWEKEVTLGGSGGALKWSPCGRYLAAVQKGQIAIYDARDGLLLGCKSMQYPSDVTFSMDSSLIAFGSWQNGFVEAFSPETI